MAGSAGIEVKVDPGEWGAVVSPEALAFVAQLERRFGPRRRELLSARRAVQARLDAGGRLSFLPETRAVREGDWRVAPVGAELADRRVEITGPTDPKMVINALNSGAQVFMADFEDATAPSWKNLLAGQQSLIEAVRRTLRYTAPNGKAYRLNEKVATLFVRPRGWHLPEAHVLVDGRPMSASLFDLGLFFFHNAAEQARRGTAPYFYLPKLEHHLEARLWNDVLVFAEEQLGLARGTAKVTVLIETLPAAFQMHEILHELQERSAGLNCGRWDYIFSFIKKHAAQPWALMPDRSQVTMDKGFLRAYSELLVQTCHRRGAHAMGGMAAFIPIKDDPAANEAALAKVRADKLREVQAGHDGTWVAHPGLVPVARAVFDEKMPGANQLSTLRPDVQVGAEDLLRVPQGTRTEAGLRHNVRVGVQYLAAWLSGNGCVPLYDLMEDAATAEICRAQVWQQLRHRAELEGLGELDRAALVRVVDEELAALEGQLGAARYSTGHFGPARELFLRLSTAETFEEFLTLPAYSLLIELENT